ncbi:hypothetical protein K438DRAFT_1973297 [Mycena galopus ATCC 62051]|nr:hypothetical protein K438DRAFT_1973297 [Mycena galopus ATCC 62051]
MSSAAVVYSSLLPISNVRNRPQVIQSKLTLVSEIIPEALNDIIRMQPSLSYPFKIPFFLANRETKSIGV